MDTTDSAPASEAPRLPEAAPRPAEPPPKSQLAQALERATRTHDLRAISDYLVLRRSA